MKTKLPAIRTLNMVAHGSVDYPKAEEDHALLSELKIPITKIQLDDFILLVALCKKKRVKINVVTYFVLEQEMLAKLKRKWKHELVADEYKLIFSWPRKSVIDTDAMVKAIVGWYSKHFIKIEQVLKRTPKQNKLVLKKVGAV